MQSPHTDEPCSSWPVRPAAVQEATQIFELKDRINDLKEENYRHSIQNLQLEKQILSLQQNENHSKKWKYLLKQSFNAIHEEFQIQLETLNLPTEVDKTTIVDILTQTLISIRKQFYNLKIDNDQDLFNESTRSTKSSESSTPVHKSTAS